MPDEVIFDRLQLILEHASVIEQRVQTVENTEEFLVSNEASLLIDSLITRLQALSENIKKIQRIDPSFFSDAVPLNITPIIRFRDLASHHYEKLDPGMILQICKLKLPPITAAIQSYLQK